LAFEAGLHLIKAGGVNDAGAGGEVLIVEIGFEDLGAE